MRKSEERWQCRWWFLTPRSPGYLFPGLRLAMETGGEEWGCKRKYCYTGMTDNERTGQGTGSYSSVSHRTHTVAAGRVERMTFMSLEVLFRFKKGKSKLKRNLYHYYYCKVCRNKPTQFSLKWKLRNQYWINQTWNFWFQFKPLKCEDLLLFFILYVCKTFTFL